MKVESWTKGIRVMYHCPYLKKRHVRADQNSVTRDEMASCRIAQLGDSTSCTLFIPSTCSSCALPRHFSGKSLSDIPIDNKCDSFHARILHCFAGRVPQDQSRTFNIVTFELHQHYPISVPARTATSVNGCVPFSESRTNMVGNRKMRSQNQHP